MKRGRFHMTNRSENELRQAFEEIDVNGSGTIDDKEFQYMIQNKMGIKVGHISMWLLTTNIDVAHSRRDGRRPVRDGY